MTQEFRLAAGGLIDRDTGLGFRFDGRDLAGHPGDTLASALLANGVRLVGRSFKYHRPRGIVAAGSEEPNALLTLHRGAHTEPNTRATMVELADGLESASQNWRGSLRHDLMAFNDLIAPLLSTGFYYKTFMWPKRFWESVYEPAIRAAAGLGRLSGEADPDSADRGFLHCDLLVIGAGPAGLAAALTAGRAGARVILADEDFRPGGRLLAERRTLDDAPATDWIAAVLAELAELPKVRLMPRTTVFGVYDHGCYGALENRTDTAGGRPRHVLWRVRARRALLCAGASERAIAFADNDRPGILFAGAMRAYLNRWAVAPGRRVAVFTNNDDGWQTARDLDAAGIEVAALIDTRADPSAAAGAALPPGVRLVAGGRVVATRGRHALREIRLADGERLAVDALAVSGGWNPNVHLTCHHRGRPRWREDIAAFVPDGALPPGLAVAGAAAGTFDLAGCLRAGRAGAASALDDLGLAARPVDLPRCADEATGITAFWHVAESRGRAWIDLQNDVTAKDVRQARQEGFRSVELLKRYTTLGMTTDQGRTANVLGLAILAEANGSTIAETGTTIYRPPYSPVPIAAFAGRSRGKNFRPVRRTPSHAWAEERGAVFVDAGLWKRAQWFPEAGESHWRQSVDREVAATRSGVGICDVTTLGKIDIRGRDATAFVDRVYANGFAKLPVGRVRYGLMLREDGLVMDDGTTARLDENHYLMTTTTANAVPVFRHLEFCRQCLWPELDVHLISVTEQYAQVAVAGPRSRALLERLVDPGHDLSNAAFPFMACGPVRLCGGVPARLFRISFSGELAYEIAVPARYGDGLMRALMAAGEDLGVTAYGTEALGVMRVEKGHAAGNELNGQTTARDLGLERMVSPRKDSIGRVLSGRPALNREDGLRLVGFRPVDRAATLSAGAHFVSPGMPATLDHDEGWMSSVAYSPELGHAIGLGFITRGAERMGEVVRAVNPLKGEEIAVEIVPPHFVDPEGERLRA